MSSSKAEILSAVRRNRPAPSELPSITGQWITYPDRRQQFIEVLEAIGGQALIGTRTELDAKLRQLPTYSQAQKIASLVPGIGESNIDFTTIKSPHALDNVDIAILPGEFAVAENAAVWVTDREVPMRVLYFLCQHLILVVSSNDILDHMHAAYERLPPFTAPSYGAFIAGPSKTADIEQSLIIGAHGPRSLTVCLLE